MACNVILDTDLRQVVGARDQLCVMCDPDMCDGLPVHEYNTTQTLLTHMQMLLNICTTFSGVCTKTYVHLHEKCCESICINLCIYFCLAIQYEHILSISCHLRLAKSFSKQEVQAVCMAMYRHALDRDDECHTYKPPCIP